MLLVTSLLVITLLVRSLLVARRRGGRQQHRQPAPHANEVANKQARAGFRSRL